MPMAYSFELSASYWLCLCAHAQARYAVVCVCVDFNCEAVWQEGQIFCFVFNVRVDMMFDTRFTFSSFNVAILIVSYCAYL